MNPHYIDHFVKFTMLSFIAVTSTFILINKYHKPTHNHSKNSFIPHTPRTAESGLVYSYICLVFPNNMFINIITNNLILGNLATFHINK